MQNYDPDEAPDPEEWLALDEQERIGLVRDYHRAAGIRLPNATMHATLQAIVETQIALRRRNAHGAHRRTPDGRWTRPP
jgi:hypothetical protein